MSTKSVVRLVFITNKLESTMKESKMMKYHRQLKMQLNAWPLKL